MSAVVAAALLLCSPSILAFVEAASPSLCHPPSPSSRRPSALFVTPLSRRSFVSDSLHPMKAPHQRERTPTLDTTWSNAVRQKSNLNESRFGVRKRVRSVLDKAKKRTGIDNASVNGKEPKNADGGRAKRNAYKRLNDDAYFYQTGLNIIAETASIGGLDLVVDEEGSVDVALDYISSGEQPPVKSNNGTSQSAVTIIEEGSSSGGEDEDPAISTKLLGEVVNGAAIKNGVVNRAAPKNGVRASPRPSSAPTVFQRPEDNFVLSTKENSKGDNSTARTPFTEKEAFTGDVSAAFSLPREPLPFALPALDRAQSRRVVAGDRVQFQDDMGRAGSGYVVWDVKAPADVVWDCLLDFQSYPQTITTVREVVMYTNTHLKEDYRAERPLDFEDGTAAVCRPGVPSVTRAKFFLSKFRLKIAAVHKYRPHPQGDYMIFTLDPASRNPVLKYAKGIWYTQSDPDGKEGYTRVWLLCELRVSRLLPQWIVEYAATRAMPRATSWLKPMTEAAATLWLKDSAKR